MCTPTIDANRRHDLSDERWKATRISCVCVGVLRLGYVLRFNSHRRRTRRNEGRKYIEWRWEILLTLRSSNSRGITVLFLKKRRKLLPNDNTLTLIKRSHRGRMSASRYLQHIRHGIAPNKSFTIPLTAFSISPRIRFAGQICERERSDSLCDT